MPDPTPAAPSKQTMLTFDRSSIVAPHQEWTGDNKAALVSDPDPDPSADPGAGAGARADAEVGEETTASQE